MASPLCAPQKPAGEFDAANRMRKLFGDSGVEIERQLGAAAPQKTAARKMIASFAHGGEWDTIDLDENVHFTQADRSADARHATMLKSSNAITLTGAPAVADAETRTTAAKIEIQQDSGAVSATGGVRTSYLATPSPQSANPSIGPGPAHIPRTRSAARAAKATSFTTATRECGKAIP